MLKFLRAKIIYFSENGFFKILFVFLLAILAFYLRIENISFFHIAERWDNYDIYYRAAADIADNPALFDGRMPFYPYFLAFFYKFFGFDFRALLNLNIAVNVFAGFSVFWFLKKYFSFSAGLVFFFLWAINPRQIYASNVLMVENFYALSNIFLLIFTAFSFRKKSYILGGGFFWAISMLIRSPMAFFHFPLAVYFFFKKDYEKLKILAGVFVLGLIFLIPYPWLEWHYSKKSLKLEVPVAINFLEASRGAVKSLSLNKSEVDALLQQSGKHSVYALAWDNIKENPSVYFFSVLKRFLLFLKNSFLLFGDNNQFYIVIVLILFSFGFLVFMKKNISSDNYAAKLSLYFFLYYVFVHSFFSYMDRFTYVTDFFVCAVVAIPFSFISKEEFPCRDERCFLLLGLPFSFFLLFVYVFMIFHFFFNYDKPCHGFSLYRDYCKKVSDEAVLLIKKKNEKAALGLLKENYVKCKQDFEYGMNLLYLNPAGKNEILNNMDFFDLKCGKHLREKDRQIYSVIKH